MLLPVGVERANGCPRSFLQILPPPSKSPTPSHDGSSASGRVLRDAIEVFRQEWWAATLATVPDTVP